MTDTKAGSTSPASNPFTEQGVAVYGRQHKTCVFRYMDRTWESVGRYLSDGPSSPSGPSPIALSGAHGSGKTHFLSWLSEQVRGVKSADAICLYGKADSSSFADLYRELLKHLSRPRLVEVIGYAIRNLAERNARSAEITKDLGDRIRDADNLVPIFNSGYISREEVYSDLRDYLQSVGIGSRGVEGAEDRANADQPASADEAVEPAAEVETEGVPGRDGDAAAETVEDEDADDRMEHPSGFAVTMAKAILMLENPQLGEAAFSWLNGDNVELSDGNTRLASSLFMVTSTGQRSSADATAIDALESIAALCWLAGRPFVVIVDQLEVFTRTSDSSERLEIFNSLIKKFVEKLKQHGGLAILAGAPDAWDALRLDVWPRISSVDPTTVGRLSAEETSIMLKAYLGEIHGFDESFAEALFALTGGSPREIVRIGYRVFEDHGADWNDLSPDGIKQYAVKTGTMSDRLRLAVELLDGVLAEYRNEARGTLVHQNLEIETGVEIHRLFQSSDLGSIAFAFMVSTDPVSEAGAGAQVVRIRESLHNSFPAAELVAIPVGYSSAEMQALIAATSTVIKFDEGSFQSELRLLFARLARPKAPDAVSADDRVAEAILRLEKRLEEVAAVRKQEDSERWNTVATELEEKARPEFNARELKTRWQMLDVLDEAREVISGGDWARERQLIRSLLVANELNVHSSAVDYGGSLYLEMLDLLRAPNSVDKSRKNELRLRTLDALSGVLRPKNAIAQAFDRPMRALLLGLAVGLGIWLLGFLLYDLLIPVQLFMSTETGTTKLTPDGRVLLVATVIAGLISPLWGWIYNRSLGRGPFHDIENSLNRMREISDS